MDFVDDEDDVPELFHLVDEPLHPVLKLAAELRAGDDGGHIHQIDLLVGQLAGNLSVDDALRERFGHRRFAHARLADEAGVVLLAAAENLHHALQLFFTADDGVQLLFARLAGQVHTELGKVFALGLAVALRAPLGLGLPFDRQAAAHDGVEIERGRAALVVRFVVRLDEGDHPRHLVGHRVEFLLRNAELADDVAHRLDAQFLRAAQAQPLRGGLPVFGFRNVNHRHTLFAAGTQLHLHHSVLPFVMLHGCRGVFSPYLPRKILI